MTRSPLPHLVRRALARHTLAGVPDAELLDRFNQTRDSQAFTELVERYAPLVWGTCRRVLGDASRAEEAFQATLVTFARKAGSVRQPDRLAGWLHGVARRTAWHFRGPIGESGTVPDRESRDPSPLEQVSGKELVAVIEAEVDRLPEKYRTAVLVCWFEDTSLEEAAGRLGVSRGVLWGRLRWARERLKGRLARRGFGLPAVLGAGLLGTGPASARLVERAVEAALRAPAGVGASGSMFGLAPVARPVGLAALVAAAVVGVVTMLPAGGPDAPPPKDPPPAQVLTKTDDGFPLPAGALHRFGNRQARHADGSNGVLVSPDGKLVATIGNASVVVWDVKTMVAKTVIRDQKLVQSGIDVGTRAAFSPDSRRLLLAVHPGNVLYQSDRAPSVESARVFDVETGKVVFALKVQADYHGGAWPAAGGKEVAVYAHQAITYFDAKDGKELRKVACGPELVGYPTASPDGRWLAMRRNDSNTLRVVDTATGKAHLELTVESFGRVEFSRDGKRMAVVDGAGKVHVHDLDAKKELFAFDTPAGKGLVAMQFSADGKTLYFGGQHGRLYRWDLKANKKLKDVGSHSTWNLTGLALSPDETVLYSTAWDRVVRRWDLKTLTEIPAPDGYITQTAAIPLPDGKTLLIADHQGALDRWDLATGKHRKRLQGQKAGGINCVAVSADGRWFAGGRTLQDVTLWDLHAGQFERFIPLVEQPDPKGSDHVRRVAFSADGKVLFTNSGKTGVTAWEVPTGKKLWNTAGTGPAMAVDPKGRWVAVGGGFDRTRIQWTMLDAATGEVVRRVDVPAEEFTPNGQAGQIANYPPYLTDLRFTPDGSRLVTAHYDDRVRVWDPDAGRMAGWFAGTGRGGNLAVSADGRWVGVGQQDRQITVWELATGKKVRTLTGHDSPVREVEFTPNGRGIVGNADLAPILWTLDPNDGTKVDAGTWDVLASDDGAKVYPAQWALVRDPAAAVKLLGEKIQPAELALARAKFDKWVADVDSPRFRVRELAEQELKRAGIRLPLGWVRKALADSKSDEARARLSRVLTLREKPHPEEWRLGRAVQVLELIGSGEALALLKAWSAVDGSPVAELAKAAVGRVERR